MRQMKYPSNVKTNADDNERQERRGHSMFTISNTSLNDIINDEVTYATVFNMDIVKAVTQLRKKIQTFGKIISKLSGAASEPSHLNHSPTLTPPPSPPPPTPKHHHRHNQLATKAYKQRHHHHQQQQHLQQQLYHSLF
ncbi:uncharacterized protein LOC131997977 [Stomoxys calcitrans]|uniref:uncharacterized protein LOC131997977 n=1 Tax=Stomoxys calcitrans TaxID=35570 RepID=UPI0027E21A01|nr:uncharacterized protein LOC131997977 [Stomoxys calcitrans]